MKKNISYCGFTMIELLTVIVIISLLMSILLPALSATRDEAYKTVCITNLAHWGYLFTLYTEDHNGRFFAGDYNYTDPNGVLYQNRDSDMWLYAMEPYYGGESHTAKFKFCPVTKRNPGSPYTSRASWQLESDSRLSGSYGLNAWVCDTPKEVSMIEGHNTRNNWRKMFITSRQQVPLMADALWHSGRPENEDQPPEQEDYLIEWQDQSTDQMQRFVVDRHRGQVNVLFLDGTVKTMSPKALWRLKWHKRYNTNAPLPEWPEWMEQFQDPN